jgi:hypothetical protein
VNAEPRQHVNQRVRAEEVQATAQQITHAGLRDAQDRGGLGLRQVPRANRFPKLDQQIGSDQQMLRFLGREREIAKDIAAGRRDLQSICFRIVSSPLVHQCAIAIARQLQLVWWRLAGPFLERVHDVHRFRARGDVEYAVFELGLNPDLSSRISRGRGSAASSTTARARRDHVINRHD